MSDSAITFDSDKAERFFRELQKNVKQVSEYHREYVNTISKFVFEDIIDHFDKERGPTAKWKGWSKAYAERMARTKVGNKTKGGNKILQDSRRMVQSFQLTNWRQRSKGIEWYNPAKTADDFPYAYAHNEGGPILPKREFMWLSPKAMSRIAATTAAWAANGSAKGAG